MNAADKDKAKFVNFLEDTKILRDAREEMERQIEKWGEQNHHPHVYLSILVEEVGEVAKAILKTEGEGQKMSWEDVEEELIQVIAVGFSMLKSLKRNQLS